MSANIAASILHFKYDDVYAIYHTHLETRYYQLYVVFAVEPTTYHVKFGLPQTRTESPEHASCSIAYHSVVFRYSIMCFIECMAHLKFDYSWFFLNFL